MGLGRRGDSTARSFAFSGPAGVLEASATVREAWRPVHPAHRMWIMMLWPPSAVGLGHSTAWHGSPISSWAARLPTVFEQLADWGNEGWRTRIAADRGAGNGDRGALSLCVDRSPGSRSKCARPSLGEEDAM
jgi:hypothetical protein